MSVKSSFIITLLATILLPVVYNQTFQPIHAPSDWTLLISDTQEWGTWIDVKEVWAKTGDSQLYLRVVHYETIPTITGTWSSGNYWLDTDFDSSTGCTYHPGVWYSEIIGYDYYLWYTVEYGESSFSTSGGVYKWNEAEQSWDYVSTLLVSIIDDHIDIIATLSSLGDPGGFRILCAVHSSHPKDYIQKILSTQRTDQIR